MSESHNQALISKRSAIHRAAVPLSCVAWPDLGRQPRALHLSSHVDSGGFISAFAWKARRLG